MEKPEACKGCPLEQCGRGYVPGAGPKSARLLLVGEAPGGEEIRQGEPFVGPTGEKVNLGLNGTRGLTRLENVRRCLPPENESPEMREKSIAHCTAAYLNREVAGLEEARAVVLIGADALEWGTRLRAYTWTREDGRKINEPGIMQYHGSVFTGPEASGVHYELSGSLGPLATLPALHTVVATLHPAFALRGQPGFMPEILANIRRGVTAANQLPPVARSLRQVINFNPPVSTIRPERQTVLDIETPEDNPSRIELCCVTMGPNEVAVFDWMPPYRTAVGEILASPRIVKIGHNFAYDVSAFLDNGMDVATPVLDTIIAAARVWPPTAQKKLNEQTSRERIPVKKLSLDRVVLRLLPDVVYWKRPESRATRAFFKVAFPTVKPSNYRMLYNGLDGIYNHRAWLAMREILKSLGLLDRLQNVDMVAFLPMVHMERRGVPVDENRRAQLLQECEQTKAEAEARIEEIAGKFHTKRRKIVMNALAGLLTREVILVTMLRSCEKHNYKGLTKRVKDPCCAAVYAENAEQVADIKKLRAQQREGVKKLKQIGEKFDPAKADHWRWLLFDAEGLNSEREKGKWIKPVAWTKKKREPQIDDKSMERLQRKYDDVELFRLKVEATYAEWRIHNTLAVKVDYSTHRAHTKLSIHRTSTARYSSGTDREDAEKIRYAAAGNQQNIPDADRSIYVAPFEWWMIAPDYSQIEARVTAWRAREMALLEAWRRGEDIHTNNAIILAKAIGVTLKPEDARELVFPFDPQRKSYRDNGKILTHAWDYGMDVAKTSRDFGLPMQIAARLHAGYFEAYPRLLERIKEVEREALDQGWLRNAFSLRLGPYEREKVNGVWRLKNRNEALAAQPQSDVGDMMKIVSADLDKWPGWVYPIPELLTTMHDNFWIVAWKPLLGKVAERVKGVMERPWPQLGGLPGYGAFRCPVEISYGENGGKRHKHEAKCLARGCDKTENPNGLIKLKEAA